MGKSRRKRRKLSNGTKGGLKTREHNVKVSIPLCPWDTGPDTPAQRAGKIIEDAGEIDAETGTKRNPNGVKRARRVDVPESLHRQGYVTTRGLRASKEITEAFERTQQSKPAISAVNVDTSSQPDLNVAIAVDRISKYRAVTKAIPSECWYMVMWVCVDGMHPASHPNFKRMRNLSPKQRHTLGCKTFGQMIESVAMHMGY